MKKVKEKIQLVIDECTRVYEKYGVSAVIDFVKENAGFPVWKDIKYEVCNACDAEMPALNHNCLICGQETKSLYFEIIAQGWNANLQREEIQIHCGENGNLFLIKTDEGFIVDVYNQDDNVDTMTVWEDDLTSD